MDYFKREEHQKNSASSTVKWCFNQFLKLMYPTGTYCICCGNYIDDSRTYLLCDHCVRHFTWGNIFIDLKEEALKNGRKAYLDSAIACIKYGVYERRLIFSLKYNKETFIARVIGDIIFDRICSDAIIIQEMKKNVAIIPVPIHKRKAKERGFNQTYKIGKYLGRNLGIPVLQDGLIREKETLAQRSVSGDERYLNLEGAFRFNRKYEAFLKEKSVILLDDVYTTGATAHICGKALKEGGVKKVNFIALATGNDFAKGI